MPTAPKYRIIKKLEAGGMAEVFCAEMESIEGFTKQVAIKRVLPHLSQNRQFIAMFLDEARLSLKFNHANVVQTFDIGVADNTYFITMEYVDGINMKKVLEYCRNQRRAMDPSHAAYVANEMCKGLAYAHSLCDTDGRPLGVVHRDVSPPNILLSKQGEVKLVDFGLAKAASQLEQTEPGIIKGKFSYLSPEAAWGRDVDHRADVFATGIILWEMLAGGRKLFQGNSDYETVMMVREAKVPPITKINRAVPPQFDQILAKALHVDPDHRYQSAADMGRDLTSAMFSLGKAVSNFDIANLVAEIMASEPRESLRAPDIVDLLIEEELAKLTSIEASESPFSEGSKPISTTEISGMLEAQLEDPRKWALEMGVEQNGTSPTSHEGKGTLTSGWKELRAYDLGQHQPAAKFPPHRGPMAAYAASSFSVSVEVEKKGAREKSKRGTRGEGGPYYLLWFILLFLAMVVLGIAYYFLIFL